MSWPGLLPGRRGLSTHCFINSPSIPGPFFPKPLPFVVPMGFVFGSHELFSLPFALCPSAVDPQGELSKGPGQWQEVLSSKKRERPQWWGWGLPEKASSKGFVGALGLLPQRTGTGWRKLGVKKNLSGNVDVGEVVVRTAKA